MRPIEFFSELKNRNKSLFWFGWFNMGLLMLAWVMMMADNTVISGINAWIKPSKFAISIVVYAWTFAWLLHYLPGENRKKLIAFGIIICMLVENGLIFMQAARGLRSHFNITTAFDGMVFGTMGLFIAFNTIIVLYTIILFFSQQTSLSDVQLWAWRAGLIFFFLGGISGGIMSAMLTHTIGATDGGPGLPFVNWSTAAGDIRAAHFFTLHGLQILPLAAFVFTKFLMNRAKYAVAIFGLTYLGFCLWLHWLAFSGLPFISLD